MCGWWLAEQIDILGNVDTYYVDKVCFAMTVKFYLFLWLKLWNFNVFEKCTQSCLVRLPLAVTGWALHKRGDTGDPYTSSIGGPSVFMGTFSDLWYIQSFEIQADILFCMS